MGLAGGAARGHHGPEGQGAGEAVLSALRGAVPASVGAAREHRRRVLWDDLPALVLFGLSGAEAAEEQGPLHSEGVWLQTAQFVARALAEGGQGGAAAVPAAAED